MKHSVIDTFDLFWNSWSGKTDSAILKTQCRTVWGNAQCDLLKRIDVLEQALADIKAGKDNPCYIVDKVLEEKCVG